ncbi:hypothetical protein Psi02_79360 [Planotetraspora silvatica]|uniref:DUF397 domain-containing protein n=1 Tax=Planotetraspora silvatica TaxID=234614 RepID=A0A8J3UUD1_9ACTN|nr:DUF397 domain-containing protein [Planotetraspora silvatica]GII51512.1 hypothetical protein Psi02_79360 [Planotetraspora silvatica]
MGTAPSIEIWEISTFSRAADNCVEVGVASTGQRAVRNSKDRLGPVVFFTLEEWRAFVDGVKAGQFDVR